MMELIEAKIWQQVFFQNHKSRYDLVFYFDSMYSRNILEFETMPDHNSFLSFFSQTNAFRAILIESQYL